ncbi:cysteine protease StiP family protein [Frankia sp. Cppng1_Ct_nod]|uniref:cysteine protease StiP family protein n=1 Tax=Frankia sp. Cppng1_Ct_nod TaxID=2897162 RepID=UPI0010413AC4|nr:cysteine protease StiP family protein [Frankia sp. Cppng1_Ct_nod]
MPGTIPGTVGSGSYDPADVTFLLKDLSDVPLERPTEDREEDFSKGRHYSEDLPVEYEPSDAYLALFESALARSAVRVATAVGVATELVLATREKPVIVSLARAGTPAGILMRRWALWRHGLDLAHYSISVIKDRGLDENAVRWILDRHDRTALQFVDGWTGKGAILKVLQAAARDLGVDGSMAVISDPGHCTSIYGTRDDFLIPHSCLNSTVSGLVSRTVLNPALIGPDDFHGAKYYRHLADRDYSRRYVEAVVDAFPAASEAVTKAALRVEDRTSTWAGWRAVEALARDYGIANIGLVKPGVGETTRVLLRRVPWKVVVAPDRLAELAHILSLCEAKGVDVEERADLPYSCVGIIKPLDGRPDRALFNVPS